MVEEVATETNAVQTPREPEVTPAAAAPAPAQSGEAQPAQKSTTSPQSRKQTASAPAPAAAPAEPGKKEIPQASELSGGMQGGMQGMMQMIFMMIAQLFGINITAMQQAQANPNKPALTATAPLGVGLKPTSTGPGLDPNAPSGQGLKVPGTTPTPSQSQVRTVDNKIDAAAKPAIPPKPDTGIQLTTGVPLEKDEARSARLGMTQKQYDGLKAEESKWQADARADGAIGDSPFVRADRQDAMAQQKLGLDAIQWQVLKYENKDWQTKIDAGDKTLPKVGPMQQAFLEAEKKTALAAALAAAPASDDPLGDFIEERGLDKPEPALVGANEVQPSVPYRAEPMFPKSEEPVTEDDIRRGAAAVREQMKRQTAVDNGDKPQKTAPQKNPDEFGSKPAPYRAEPMFPKSEEPVTEDDIRRGAAAVRVPVHMTPSYNDASGIEQARRMQPRADGVIPALVVDGEDPAVSRMKREYAEAPASRPVAPQRSEMMRQSPGYSVREPYNNASGVDDLNKTLARRADLREQGYAPAVAKQLTDDHRLRELTDRGLDERTAMGRVRAESRMADLQERGMQTDQRGMERIIRQMEQNDRQAAAENRRVIQQTGRDFGQLARGGVILGGGTGSQAGAAQQVATGIAGVAGPVLSGIFGGSSADSRQLGNSAGTLARGGAILSGATGRDAGALSQVVSAGTSILSSVGGSIFGGGRSEPVRIIEYPQQRGGYVDTGRVRGFSLDRSDQISDRYNNVSSSGVTEEQRQKIIADYQMQQSQAAERTPDSSYYNRNPNNIFTPGG